MSAPIEQIVVWDGQPTSGPAGTAADTAAWERTGLPRKVIPVGNGFIPPPRLPAADKDKRIERRPRAMLFSDIHGFSGLRDDQLPAFIEVILNCCANVIGRNRVDILFANTWGDGLFLVFDDAGKAAACALEMQEALGQIDLTVNGLPAHMGLRVGLHLGPIYAAHDPILEQPPEPANLEMPVKGHHGRATTGFVWLTRLRYGRGRFNRHRRPCNYLPRRSQVDNTYSRRSPVLCRRARPCNRRSTPKSCRQGPRGIWSDGRGRRS
jgi:hypothetical protein